MGDAERLLSPGWTCDKHEPDAITSWVRERTEIWTQVPLPGRGFTRDRWRVLSLLGAGDLSAARLVEGHLDALAITNDLGVARPGSDRRFGGGWAAQPGSVRASIHEGAWTLHGQKEWCSGADVIEYAVVTATAMDGLRLFEVTEAGIDVLPESWTPRGMVASASATVAFDSAVDVSPLGGPNAYIDRAGFGHGGVAAVWFGAASTALASCRPIPEAVSDRARWGRGLAALEAARRASRRRPTRSTPARTTSNSPSSWRVPFVSSRAARCWPD